LKQRPQDIIMEDLIRSKIAELEVNFPEQLIEQKLAEEFQKIENAIVLDESFICRQFDSAVIDERNPLEDRIAAVRNIFIDQVRSAKNVELEYHDLVTSHKTKCQRNNQLKEELTRKNKEKLTVDELRIKLQDMNKLLQRQIKEVAEESKRLHDMEKQRMEELSSTFSTTITEITQKIAQQEEEQMKQAGDNQQLREKLAEFSSHSKLRDQHFQSQVTLT
jgi:DNA repair exonuclease SbcCD ATPase subunit